MGKNNKYYRPMPKTEVRPKEVINEENADAIPEEETAFVPETNFVEPEEVRVVAEIFNVPVGLNIRNNHKIEPNNIIAILGKGTKLVVIDPSTEYDGDGEKWYKVEYLNEVGYAMKKYIKILEEE